MSEDGYVVRDDNMATGVPAEFAVSEAKEERYRREDTTGKDKCRKAMRFVVITHSKRAASKTV